MTYPILMVFQLFRPRPRAATIRALYGAIVAQARAPAFYRDYGVPDTVNGRFEMVLLHTVLVLRRLRREDEALRRLGQGVFDTFCADMDGTLREWGVGDLAVPRQMRRIGEAFYGRQAAYDEALQPRGALEALLERVFDEDGPTLRDAHRLAQYIRNAAALLESRPAAAVGQTFPDPQSVDAHGAISTA